MSKLAGSTHSLVNEGKSKRMKDVPKKVYVLEDVCEEVLTALKSCGSCSKKISANVARDIATSCSDSLFILSDFSSEAFNTISGSNNWILGPTAVLELASKNEPITPRRNPVYCLSMDGFNCFISLKEKDRVSHLMKLIRSMGGSVRAKLSEAMYFIAETTLASGYLYSNTYNIPTLASQWVDYMWGNRHIPAFKCDAKTIKYFTLKPFRGLHVAFLHFPPDERSHIELLEQNHGVLVDIENPSCTHVVIDDFSLSEQFSQFKERKQVKFVHAEWFWTCIQFEARVSENDFSFLTESDENAAAQQTPVIYKSKNSLNWCELMIDPSLRFSMDSSHILDDSRSVQGGCCSNPKCQMSHEFILEELLSTEKNYVDVLEAIQLIKEKAENEKQTGGPMINTTESKQIFLNTQELLTLHKIIHDDIKNSLIENKGKKAFSVYSKYSDDLKTQYPKFCNGFEEARKAILSICNSNPRFRALLEISKNKPESGRQKLQELIHRPLQRLGSVTLLIKEILNKTDKDCKEKNVLEEGLQSVEAALRLMNEELIEAEKLSSVFRVYTSIKDCPVTLVSSHRCLRVTFFSQELTGNVSIPGDCLAFHLFSDVLEYTQIQGTEPHLLFIVAGYFSDTSIQLLLVRWREDSVPQTHPTRPITISRFKKKVAIATLKNKRKVENTIKEENNESLYKHLQLLPLHKIKQVVDVIDNADVKDAYGLVVRETLVKDSVWCFRYMNDLEYKLSKKDLVIFIAKCLARYECSGDVDKYWVALKPHEVDERLKTSIVPYQSSVKKLLCSVTEHLSPSSSKIARLGTRNLPK